MAFPISAYGDHHPVVCFIASFPGRRANNCFELRKYEAQEVSIGNTSRSKLPVLHTFGCVCGCVCVCVFIFFHSEGFFGLQNVQDILQGTDQRSSVVNICWLRYAKFHHRRIWKCHIVPPKTKNSSRSPTGEKTIWYNAISAKRWYILI